MKCLCSNFLSVWIEIYIICILQAHCSHWHLTLGMCRKLSYQLLNWAIQSFSLIFYAIRNCEHKVSVLHANNISINRFGSRKYWHEKNASLPYFNTQAVTLFCFVKKWGYVVTSHTSGRFYLMVFSASTKIKTFSALSNTVRVSRNVQVKLIVYCKSEV
jgi:hypothetical protein